MTYAVEFSHSAQKEIKKLQPRVSKQVMRAIHMLRDNPRKGNVRPMTGSKSWRMRVGEYRVVYDIGDDTLVILIIRVRPRGGAYSKWALTNRGG